MRPRILHIAGDDDKLKKNILIPVANNFRAILLLGDFRKVFSFHRLSPSEEMLGKVVDYLGLSCQSEPVSILTAGGRRTHTGVPLEASFTHLCWAEVASFLYPTHGVSEAL